MAKARYKEWLEADNLLKIEAWARDGLSYEQIASNIGISVRTLSRWRDKYSPICQSLKKGREVADIEVENVMHKSALGYYVEESKTFITIEGKKEIKKVEKTKRWIAPNTTAQIFWLKNRKPDVWMDRKAKEVEEDSNIGLKRYFELLDDELIKDE